LRPRRISCSVSPPAFGFAASQQRQEDSSAKIAALEIRVREETQRADVIEADNATLRDALGRAQAARAEVAAKKSPMPREALEERFRTARNLGRSGDPAHALRELLWYWDEGLKQGDNATVPARRSGLAASLRDLAARHPPAREEMQRRRDALRARILASPGGDDWVPEYTALLRVLGEEPAVLGLLDQLPAGDRRRSTITIYASDQLIAARRYAEAMEGKSAGPIFSLFESNARMASMSTAKSDGGPSSPARSTARDIELLAGAGHVADARELAQRLLALDHSEGTRALIQRHAERAGQPDLLSNRAP
jgi:hypothetical protein